MINFPAALKKTNSAVFPKYTSLIKDHKHLTEFLNKLEENQNKSNIIEFYTEIDNQIQIINENLVQAFKKQEDDLLNNYCQEMYKAQRHFKDLTEEMNEEKLKKRMNQRKEELEAEREQLLRESINLSNKCNEFKENLKEVSSYSQEIEDELRFLDEQLVYADQQNTNLKQEVLKYQEEILKIDPDYPLEKDEEIWDILSKNKAKKKEFPSSFSGVKEKLKDYSSPYSYKTLKESAYLPQNAEEFQQAKENLKLLKIYNQKLKDSLNNPCFEMGLFERVFVESAEKVKKRSIDRFVKRSGVGLPGIPSNKSKDKSMNFEKDVSSSKMYKGNSFNNESLSTEMSVLSDIEMSDLDKRLIMEEFLGNEEVKREIYRMLFEEKELSTAAVGSSI